MARLLVKDVNNTVFRVLAEHLGYWFLVERRVLAEGETPPAPIVGLKSDYTPHVPRPEIGDRLVHTETGTIYIIRGVYQDDDGALWVRLQDLQGAMHFYRGIEVRDQFERVTT